jgi:hypothetical protein
MNSNYMRSFCIGCLNKKNINNEIIKTNKKLKNEIFSKEYRKSYNKNWVEEIKYYKY